MPFNKGWKELLALLCLSPYFGMLGKTLGQMGRMEGVIVENRTRMEWSPLTKGGDGRRVEG